MRLEFHNSPYGLKMEDLMQMGEQYEKSRFTYRRAEERRRVRYMLSTECD